MCLIEERKERKRRKERQRYHDNKQKKSKTAASPRSEVDARKCFDVHEKHPIKVSTTIFLRSTDKVAPSTSKISEKDSNKSSSNKIVADKGRKIRKRKRVVKIKNVEERRRYEREKKRKQRAKIYADPKLYSEF